MTNNSHVRSPKGIPPAVFLANPKYPHNVGAAQRACSCFGVGQLWMSGDRVSLTAYEGYRLPREERMRGYKDVTLTRDDRALDRFDRSVTVVGVELVPGAMPMTYFEHPDRAVYVFGPEDGGLSKAIRTLCHRFVFLPTRHCTNLSAAVYIALYDRQLKAQQAGRLPVLSLEETLADGRYDEVEQDHEVPYVGA